MSEFSGCHKDRISYLLVVRVSGFAWFKDLRYVIHWLLDGEFMSLFPSLDDEYNTHDLVSCGNIKQHRLANTWGG